MADVQCAPDLDFYKTGIFVLEQRFSHFGLAVHLFNEAARVNIQQRAISSDFDVYLSTWKHIPIVADYRLQDCFSEISSAAELHSALMSHFGAKIKTISFYNARPGLDLHLHRDMSGNLMNGKLRIHIPIVTNENCFYLFKSRSSSVQSFHAWQGGAFVLDTGYLHGVKNNSSLDRVHLMVELHVSSTVRNMLPPVDYHWFMHCLNFLLILIPLAAVKRFRHVLSSFY
ncbi:aspartyl/asparaginyl beta-hydroxylase domain-containing protein [bacterium]|nr:aspartyl/asparaginyl beta-hydroxylase domain-containing protein [bacterium]